MINGVAKLLSVLPDSLRDTLLQEYREIVQNYAEHRWGPSELQGGRFCEVVYSILHGYAVGAYANGPSKPRDFVGACRALESHAHVPRSFQILIPRILPALYEIRNNRGVGHVGGDVDPNYMDATFVLGTANWVLAELIRVFHTLPVREAQQIVSALVERKVPLVWTGQSMKRVLNPTMSLKDVILVLLATSIGTVSVGELLDWSECKDKSYFKKLLRELHSNRMIEYKSNSLSVQLLPPGNLRAEHLLREGSEELSPSG